MRTRSKGVLWSGAGLVLAQGVVHLFAVPGSFATAVSSGAIFALIAAAAIVSAAGIARGAAWGWIAGLTVTAGWLGLYIAIRTAVLLVSDGEGSLAIAVDEWFRVPGPGTLAWIAQGVYVLLFACAFGPSITPGRYRRVLSS